MNVCKRLVSRESDILLNSFDLWVEPGTTSPGCILRGKCIFIHLILEYISNSRWDISIPERWTDIAKQSPKSAGFILWGL